MNRRRNTTSEFSEMQAIMGKLGPVEEIKHDKEDKANIWIQNSRTHPGKNQKIAKIIQRFTDQGSKPKVNGTVKSPVGKKATKGGNGDKSKRKRFMSQPKLGPINGTEFWEAAGDEVDWKKRSGGPTFMALNEVRSL